MKRLTIIPLLLRAIARRLRHWSDFLLAQAGEAERPALGDTAEAMPRALAVSPAQENEEADSLVTGPPAHWLARVTPDAPPAHWLARVTPDTPPVHWQKQVRQGAPELLERVQPLQQPMQLPSRPSPEAIFSSTEAKLVQTESPRYLLPPHSTQHEEGASVRQTFTEGERSSSHPALATSLSTAPHSPSLLSSPMATMQTPALPEDMISQRDRPVPLVDNVQPPFPTAARPEQTSAEHGQKIAPSVEVHSPVSSAPDGDTYVTDDLWPSLPTDMLETPPSIQEWEMLRRHWQRWQRLDAEQRGRSWSG